ncbi:Acireductone dioxygenase [Hyphopichia burtonii NRRL Y-1933]|uniref:Acireductone dioxygenase n=1 Tax=Hyphopichia burtonii NRRL Y-1933 TaxID=984485 RepID=A0A1E4RPL9_9ASCO|nr:Acireductone dioxygenase [Hyphopichia burtonii NRRL Y-1933]ODV69222.1 Acireductone dioxygenase [Hyphopichia burtonii NRRL Y-1933]
MVEVYLHDNKDTPENFTDAHNSGESVSLEELSKIGVIYRYIDSEDKLNELAKERDYKNRDQVSLNLGSFNDDIEAFNNKMAQFYKEHYHEDEEIRYIVSGEGYFDVRDQGDKWIRTKLVANDLLILPAGIYHRFTLTSAKRDVKAVRLFKDEPKWEAINRDTGRLSSARENYVKTVAV